MKKLIVFVSCLFTLTCFSQLYAQELNEGKTQDEKQLTKQEKKELKKQQKLERKKQKSDESTELHNNAVNAIKSKQFILETHTLYNKRGYPVNVSPNTNFVGMNGENVVIQLAFPGGVIGPNGIGGITVTGKASAVEIRESKKGALTMSMNVIGPMVNSQIVITLNAGSNLAQAHVAQQTKSGRLRFSGYLVPMEESDVYESPRQY
ncbi:DUF4251 domain-containing protein [Limibacter armeniacum]|uniref:DUF4251 domain-containing protein n=1 Tax=Limibacter armeniacum TaxID=466084 RepID=UPI002FE68537